MASGMCASTVMLMALVPAGGHIVTTTDCYRKTRIFMETFLPKMGITVWVHSLCHLGLIQTCIIAGVIFLISLCALVLNYIYYPLYAGNSH